MSRSSQVATIEPAGVVLAATPWRIGVVTLKVRDLERVSACYRQILGVETLERAGGVVRLGAGGVISMPSDPLDVDDLTSADPLRVWSGAPDALVVGHMHLQVGAIPAAEAFYGGILGFDITCRYPGGSFFGAGGYHRQLATNVWNSRNAGPIDEAAAGLAGFEILVRDAEGLASIRQRSVTAGLRLEYMDDGLTSRDPWGLPAAPRAK